MRSYRAISELVVAVLLVVVGIIAVLMFFGQLTPMLGSAQQDLVVKPSSKIVVLGSTPYLILNLQNTDGKLTVKSVTVETDDGSIDCTVDNGDIASRATKTIKLDLSQCGATADSFGGKDTYSVLITYDKGGNEYTVSAEVMFSG